MKKPREGMKKPREGMKKPREGMRKRIDDGQWIANPI
jgi:hypothetical protein